MWPAGHELLWSGGHLGGAELTNYHNTQLWLAAGVLFALGLLGGWAGAHFLSLRHEAPTIALYDNWRLACPAASQKDRACSLALDLTDSKSGSHLGRLVLGRGDQGAVLTVTVPYNVLIGPGLGLGFGNDKPRTYPYLTCNGAGCIAQLPVDDALRTALRQENRGRLVLAGMNKQSVQISFSLQGFRRADDAARRFQSALWWLGSPV